MPPELLEVELFGRPKGADDAKAKAGCLVEADGGTLFLDEVAELPLTMQPRLLRALKDGVVRPAEGTAIPFRARIMCATARDLHAMVREKLFREDLYFQLDVLHVRVPPLRARRDDIVPLARQFLRRSASRTDKNITGIAPEAEQALTEYAWPGNVVELENCIERAVALGVGEQITLDLLPDRLRASQRPEPSAEDDSAPTTLDEVERRHVMRLLARVGGNKSEAARSLGVPRKSLYRMLERWRGRS
jgi:DNA-binding NtrC family response regulator